MIETEVLVVGAGNAAMCAALAARDAGAAVLVLERAPVEERGGNTAFTAGAMRTVYDGVDDLRALMPDLTAEELANTDFGAYRAEEFYADMERVTDYRADPDLVEVMVSRSHETLKWMAGKGIRFMPAYGRQAFKIDGRFRFWGGLTVEVVGGGLGLVESEHQIAVKAGIGILYSSRAVSLLADDSGIHGVVAVVDGVTTEIRAHAVVLACGGFQANAEWRTRYLGRGWDLAKVRGTRFNTGEGHRMALEAGASPAGHWSGCHAVGWDRNAPEYGDLAVGDGFQKHSYPFGIMVNAAGRRFVDEGADFRNYTYAKYGRRILEQPSQFAWQVFDQKVVHLLRDEYRIREVTRVQAATLEELACRLDGVDPEGFLAEVAAFNAAVDVAVPFDPTVKDGRGTAGLAVPKSNWANPLTDGPFLAFQVTCGVTFTFGGIRITPRTQVVSAEGAVLPGLFACGEIIGGLFYHNYPGGTGLTAGAVFGRIAGTNAANAAAPARGCDREIRAVRELGMMIGGRQTPARDGATFESVDPFTGEPWARIARGAAADVDAAVRGAHAAYRSKAWSALTASARGELLVRLADIALERLEDLVEIESRDNGKSRKELRAALRTMASWYRYYGGMADKVLGEVIPVDRPDSLNYTVPEPYGVVAAILPWNSPLRLAAWKIAPALAAGNAVVLKPSEHASASNLVFNELFEAAGFPAGIVNVVTGFGPDVVPALIAHPLVKKISFTGGVAAGTLVGELAARQLKPCTLELGGKSPQIVFPDADLDRAADGISAGVFASGGQTCLAGSRLLVHSAVHDEMLSRIVDRAKQVRLGDPSDPETDVGPVATAAQHTAIGDHIARAQKSGAVLAFGAEAGGRFAGPVVFDQVARDSRLFQEEVFGPVLAVTCFDSEQEAIDLANDVPFGLAAGVWTKDLTRAHRVAREVQAGTVWVNTYRNTVPQSPFGGYKASGLGRESGFAGIREYLQVKSVWVDLSGGDADG